MVGGASLSGSAPRGDEQQRGHAARERERGEHPPGGLERGGLVGRADAVPSTATSTATPTARPTWRSMLITAEPVAKLRRQRCRPPSP